MATLGSIRLEAPLNVRRDSKGINPIPHYETSAKDAVYVEQAFQTVAIAALQQDQPEDMYIPDTIDLNNTDQKKASSGCCG